MALSDAQIKKLQRELVKAQAKIAKFNSPAQQVQRGKESMTRNPQALKMKTWDQMTPSQRSSALAKEAKKAAANRTKFNKEATKRGAVNKLKAQGVKINKTPMDGLHIRGKK